MVDIDRQKNLRESIELFYFAYRAFTGRSDQILNQQGLGRVHHRILYFVGRHPDLPVKALLKTLGISKQALNAPLRQLVSREFVSVSSGKNDRRIRQLSLTREGEDLETYLTETQMKLLGDVFDLMGIESEKAWKNVMREIPEKTNP